MRMKRSFLLSKKPEGILRPKGEKEVGAAVSWERRKNVTAVCSVSVNLYREENVPTAAKEWSSWRPLFLFSRWWITD